MAYHKTGDKIKVVKIAEGYEDYGYNVGDVFEVQSVYHDDLEQGPIYDVNGGERGTIELYDWEVEAYDEAAEAAKDADVGAYVKEEHIDEYNEIVVSLSQAIADKAKQMGVVKEEDAQIYKELEGHRESEVNGILQDGISDEQAIAAMRRAKFKLRMQEAEKARKRMKALEEEMEAAKTALRKADEALQELAEEKGIEHPSIEIDWKLDEEPVTVMYEQPRPPTFMLGGKPIQVTKVNGGTAFIADSANPMGDVLEQSRSEFGKLFEGFEGEYERTEEDEEWMNMEDVGAEVVPPYGETEGHPHGIKMVKPILANDPVHQPSHYVNAGIEPIQYMADKLPHYNDGHTAFCVGNVIKYVSRAPHKGKLIEDLRKARQYLDFAIEHEEKK